MCRRARSGFYAGLMVLASFSACSFYGRPSRADGRDFPPVLEIERWSYSPPMPPHLNDLNIPLDVTDRTPIIQIPKRTRSPMGPSARV